MRTLQIITLLFGMTGTVLGLGLLFNQADRDAPTVAPCLDAKGEPTC